jgi:hypothetical protein
MLGALLDIHASETNTDGARGNNDDPVAIFAKLHGRVDN